MKGVITKPLRGLVAHSCIACPVEVRDLYATAHNATLAFEAALSGHGDSARAVRKLRELKESVERMKPIVEVHFSVRTDQ